MFSREHDPKTAVLYVCLAFILLLFPATGNSQSECTKAQIFSSRSCAGDSVSPTEKQLYDLLIKYRTAYGRPAIPLSNALSLVANRHLLDLTQNVRVFTHSWSNCPYDISDQYTWPCIADAPKRLANYLLFCSTYIGNSNFQSIVKVIQKLRGAISFTG